MRPANFLFFGFIAGKKELEQAFKGDPTPQVSAVKFQTGLIEGFTSNCASLAVLGALPIASYPRSRTVFVRKTNFSLGPANVSGVLMGGINLPILKLFVRLATSLIEGRRTLSEGRGSDGIIVYALHTPFIAASLVLKRLFKVPVFVFVPDLPMHMAGKRLYGIHSIAKRVDNWFLQLMITHVDLTFPISESMAQSWLPNSVKHLVVEGVAPARVPAKRKAKTCSKPPQILYTGQFSHITNFATMFASCPEIDVNLVFVGGGPDGEKLKQLAASDYRITVKPFVIGEALEQEFSDADYLLNPRDTHWVGARYSFPSKLFDYMARGRPILSTRMPGIPDEYFDCFLELSDNSPQSLMESFRAALETPPEEIERRIDIGEKMLATVKSPKAVTARVLKAIFEC